jgi:uncharacterized protein YbcC (UPF0753/DUF2309 family)
VTEFNLDIAIERITKWLPGQGPIKDFVAQNILQSLEDHPFHEALALSSKVYGATTYLPLREYLERYEKGRISSFAIDWAIRQIDSNPSRQLALRESLFIDDEVMHLRPISLASHGLREKWLTQIEINLDALAPPVLFRLVGSFLDQGISRWSLAKEGESFWACLGRIVGHSYLPLQPFDVPNARALLQLDPEVAINTALDSIVGDPSLYEQYLLEMLLKHPGWAGMVRRLELNPQALLNPRCISLKEFLAVELAIEVGFLFKKTGSIRIRVADVPGIDTVQKVPVDTNVLEIPLKLRVWHEAMEYTVHSELLHALRKQSLLSTASGSEAQAIFCIDDRECSIRRHLEEVDPSLETFGAAGFFGIEFLYRGANETYAVAQCPAVIKPNHLIIETDQEQLSERKRVSGKTSTFSMDRKSLMHGWLFTQTLGVGYAAKLAWDVFRPGSKMVKIRKLGEVEEGGKLNLLRQGDERTEDGRLLGFSHEEMADRIFGLLRNIGLTHNFSRSIFVVAHGSTSVNNPHFAAYDCGACSGRPGAPNARAFAWMANDATVRAILKTRGIDIPTSTRFIPALHNTTRDDVTYFDREDWKLHDPKGIRRFREAMSEALTRNAQERARHFELAPEKTQKHACHDHVRARSASIFEPRPEYTHSNNAYCVVGRRALTRNLFIDRRAFLHSYNPEFDPEGNVLLNILNAVIPVCGGINLCYYLSRIDNSIFGAGTKLPHNVIGLLGVANGVEGDLRTGLPNQMVEIHEPIRMMFVIEQGTDVIDRAIDRLGPLRRSLDNEWVRLASYNPETRSIQLYSKAGWSDFDFPNYLSVPSAPRSEDIFVGVTESIPVHLLVRGRV